MSNRKELVGIEGWLSFFAFLIWTAPIGVIFHLITGYAEYSDKKWADLSDPTSPTYEPLFQTTLNFYYISASILVLASIFIIYKFYNKINDFKYYITAFYALAILQQSILFALWSQIHSLTLQSIDLGRTVVIAIIICLYFWRSKRVKNTFVN